MKLTELSLAEVHQNLHRAGIFFRIGPFAFHLQSDLSDLPSLLHRMYGEYHLTEDPTFSDFHARLYLHRRWWRPQVQFRVDNIVPFSPFPLDTALPFLEWGLNWCIATRAHQYLMLHAGVVEKNGRAVVLPAHPGSGKSTLCAALSHRGWRLLTDEIALVRPHDLAIDPLPRLVPLKNESISVIRAFAPDAVLGPEFPKTRKGTVAHLRPPSSSIARDQEPAHAGWIVFPKFQSGAELRLEPVTKQEAFVKLTGHSMNYERIGLRGFETMSGLVEMCSTYQFQYSDLEQAIAQLDELIGA